MTFDSSGGYDGRTIHYKVKAITPYNEPEYVTMSVVDLTNNCRTSALSWDSDTTLSYSIPVYTELV